MGEHGDARVALAQAPDVRRSEPLMHLAMPLPGDDLNGGLTPRYYAPDTRPAT